MSLVPGLGDTHDVRVALLAVRILSGLQRDPPPSRAASTAFSTQTLPASRLASCSGPCHVDYVYVRVGVWGGLYFVLFFFQKVSQGLRNRAQGATTWNGHTTGVAPGRVGRGAGKIKERACAGRLCIYLSFSKRLWATCGGARGRGGCMVRRKWSEIERQGEMEEEREAKEREDGQGEPSDLASCTRRATAPILPSSRNLRSGRRSAKSQRAPVCTSPRCLAGC